MCDDNAQQCALRTSGASTTPVRRGVIIGR